MIVIEIIVLFVGIFAMGFCVGRLWNLRKWNNELKVYEGKLKHIRELSDQLDDARVKYISELLAENKDLKMQIELLARGVGVVDGENKIKLTAEDSE